MEHYKKYIDDCNEEIIEMKHLNEAINSELAETKERMGQLADEKAAAEDKLNKNKVHFSNAQEEIEVLQRWKA